MLGKAIAAAWLLSALTAWAQPLKPSVDWLDKNNGWGGLKFGMSVEDARKLGLAETPIQTTDAGKCYDKTGESKEMGDIKIAAVLYCFDPALELIMILPLTHDDSPKMYEKFVSILGEPATRGVWNGKKVQLVYKHNGPKNPNTFEMRSTDR